MVKYRAVKSNTNNDVIAIGCDENQGGVNYNNIGTWCNFTFTEIPEVTKEVSDIVGTETNINLLKVENNRVVLKTVEEIQQELDNKSVEE